MASTYSNLKIQLMATGENSGTWGDVTNTNLGTALEQAITGSANVTVNADTSITLTDTNGAQNARALRLNLSGAGGFNLTVPDIQKLYLVNNGSLGTVTVKNSTGATIAVPTTKTMWVFSTGTGVVDAVTHLTSLTLGSALPIASGGTGSTSTTYANLQTNVTGTLPIANGGTGSTSTTYANLQSNVSGVLPVANGGTGSATATFSGANITSLNASNISAGTLAVAQGGTGSSTATFSGANITSLNASALSSGTVPTARLATGTASSTTYLRGDQTWATVSSATGTVTSVATGNGLSGGTITTSGTLTVACPGFDTVGSYATGSVYRNVGQTVTAGSNYSAGTIELAVINPNGLSVAGTAISGTWKWMGQGGTGQAPCGGGGNAVVCRVS